MMGKHSYEELRGIVIDILLKRESIQFGATQYGNLVSGVGEVLARREKMPLPPGYGLLNPVRLCVEDTELVRDIFWDLFRQGFITLGLNESNDKWPWFRLSHYAEQTLGVQSPFRFHDATSFITLVKREVPDVSSEAITYLEEAVAAFYADCLLASCVMEGVAAEAEFLRLVDVAVYGSQHSAMFVPVIHSQFIRQKIIKFRDCLKPLLKSKKLPTDVVEDLETNFDAIQSILRIARNEAGHPTAVTLQREQVYVYLQLFIPFARQLMKLRVALMP